MRDQITALEELQKIDLELRELEKDLKKYPEEISSYEQEIEDIRQSITGMKEQLERNRTEKSRVDLALTENEDKINKSEQKLFDIKTHKEYEALQKEIAELKRNNADLEDRLLEIMEEIESLETSIEEKQAELSDKEERFGLLIENRKEELEELEEARDILGKEREEAASYVDSGVLSTYEKIISRNGRALVPARDEICTGCHMNIPPQLYNEVLMSSGIIQCPNCHKILYSDGDINEERQTA